MPVIKKESNFSEEEIEILFDLIQKIRKKNLKISYGLENLPEKNEIDQIAIILNNKFRALSNPKDPKNLIDNIKTVFYFHNGVENKVPRYPSMRTLEAMCSFYYEEFPSDVYEWNDTTYKLMTNWKRFKEEFALENHGANEAAENNGSADAVRPGQVIKPVKEAVNINLKEINEREGDVIPPKLLGIPLLNLMATNLSLIVLLGGVLAAGLFMLFNTIKGLPIFVNNSFSFQTELAFVNLATVFLFILLHETNYFGFKSIVNRLEGKTIVDASLKQFQAGWLGILMSLFFFYIWLSAKYVCYDLYNLSDAANLQVTQKFNLITNTFSDFFNLVTAFMFLYLYFVLDTPSVATQQTADRNKGFTKKMLLAFVTCVILLALTIFDRVYDWKIFVMVYSLFTVVAMCMFFTRLNSHFLDEGSSFIPLFFCYAALQAWYSFLLEMYDVRTRFIIFAAVLLKALLFLVINNYMQHGRFKKYFECMLLRDEK